MTIERCGVLTVMALAAALCGSPARAQLPLDPDGLDDKLRGVLPQYFHPTGGNPRVTPLDLPDVFGPGAVLRVGNVHMKVTNWGICGNVFTQLSSASGIPL